MGDVVSLSRSSDAKKAVRQAGGNSRGARRRFGYIRKLPSRRYQASYTGPDGERHNAPTTFDTKGDADAWLALQDAAITEHRWKPAAPTRVRLSLSEYTARWMERPRAEAPYSSRVQTPDR